MEALFVIWDNQNHTTEIYSCFFFLLNIIVQQVDRICGWSQVTYNEIIILIRFKVSIHPRYSVPTIRNESPGITPAELFLQCKVNKVRCGDYYFSVVIMVPLWAQVDNFLFFLKRNLLNFLSNIDCEFKGNCIRFFCSVH